MAETPARNGTATLFSPFRMGKFDLSHRFVLFHLLLPPILCFQSSISETEVSPEFDSEPIDRLIDGLLFLSVFGGGSGDRFSE